MSEHAIGRVLMTGDTVGGVWTFALDLAGALGDHGIEVLLATMGGEPSDEQRAEASAISTLRLCPSSYKLEWMSDPWRDLEESGGWLLDLAAEFHPDLIHLNTFGHGALPWQAPIVLTAHSCVASWWAAVKGCPLPEEWDAYRTLVERSLKAAGMVTAPSRAMLALVEGNYGPGLPPRRAIANGRNRALFCPAVKEPFVLSAGRLWDEAKNIAAVAAAASRLPWPVYVAGEDRHPNGEWIEFSGCRSLGRLSSAGLAGWYGRASIYALPARYEPFGLSVLEAALSGCALVLGDIESLREVWGEAALFVPPDDLDTLQATISGLMASPALLHEMAGRALSRALTFTPERTALEYLEVYASVAEPRSVACAW